MQLPSPDPSVIFQKLADGAVLFSPASELYFGLNEVGALVWGLLPPTCRSFDELRDRLAAHYPDVPAATIAADVSQLIEDLAREKLVVVNVPDPDVGRPS